LNACAPLAAFLLALSGCSAEDAGPEKKVVTRVVVPDNAFKPAALDDTIDELIDALAETEPQQLQLGVVLKTLTGYWEPVKVGANRAFGELDVSGVVLAPAEGNEEESRQRQILLLDERQGADYDGFGIAPVAEVVQPSIDAMVDSGVPVITIDSDLVSSKRQLYIGTLNYEAGQTAAGTLSDMLPSDGGTIVILGHEIEAEWPDGFRRTQGAKDVLEGKGYTVVIRQATWTEQGEIDDIEFMTTALEDADPPPVGMLSMFSPTFRCARAAEAAGLSGDDLAIVGFDFEPETLDYMHQGLIKATHAQRQYYMGYLVPYVLYSMKALGTEQTMDIIKPHMADESRFNAGLDVVHADQVDEYNAFLDSLGIGG
jgi:ribose transport system substrate-binding protein